MAPGALFLVLTAVWSAAEVPAVGPTRDLKGQQPATRVNLPAPPRPEIRPRSAWDKQPPPAPQADRVKRSRIIVHHTADSVDAAWLRLAAGSPESEKAAAGEMVRLKRLHRVEFGWRDVAYHYLVDWEGRVWAGRPVESVGAHTENKNRGSIGVALMGNLDLPAKSEAEAAARERQLDGLEAFLTWLAYEQGISPEHILGHHEYYNTACPGRYFARKLKDDLAAQRRGEESSPLRQMRLRIVARLGGGAGPAPMPRLVADAPGRRATLGLAPGRGGFDLASLNRMYDNGRVAAGPLAEAREDVIVTPTGPLAEARDAGDPAPTAPPAPPPKTDPVAFDDGRFELPFQSQAWPPVRPGGRYGAKRRYGGHSGIDFALPEGTPVYAARPGRVVFVDKRYTRAYMRTAAGKKGCGNRVLLEHPDGSETEYCHLSPGSVDVKVGEVVTRDSRIGSVGDTGHSFGPHLHFEIVDARGNHKDPAKAIRGSQATLVASTSRR